MTDKKNLITVGLVVVAILVIIESIILIDNISTTKTNKVTVAGTIPTVSQTVAPEPDLMMLLKADKSEVKVGESIKITLDLTDKTTHKIDGIEAYVKYNLSAFDISQMEYSDKLSPPDIAMNSVKKGMVLVNYLISSPADGYALDSSGVRLLSFVATPKVAGEYSFEINTSNENKESVSIVAEHALKGNVPRTLPLASNKLTVRVVAK